MSDKAPKDKSTHSFMCFILGLFVGWWPIRWGTYLIVLIIGYCLGSTFSLFTWVAKSGVLLK